LLKIKNIKIHSMKITCRVRSKKLKKNLIRRLLFYFWQVANKSARCFARRWNLKNCARPFYIFHLKKYIRGCGNQNELEFYKSDQYRIDFLNFFFIKSPVLTRILRSKKVLI
jgi:hypothetical protein